MKDEYNYDNSWQIQFSISESKTKNKISDKERLAKPTGNVALNERRLTAWVSEWVSEWVYYSLLESGGERYIQRVGKEASDAIPHWL